jgi:chitodextrinase
MRWRQLPLAAAVLLVTTAGTTTPVVPGAFQDLYDELFAALQDFRAILDRDWDGTRSPVVFGANLLSCHPGLGPELLTEERRVGVRQELDGLRALGVKAVAVDISFPMLYRPFHASEEEQRQYLAFYTWLAGEVRARGLELIVKTQVLLSRGSYSYWDLAPYYASLSLPEYRQGRMEVARTIASSLRPDYLSVLHEPDTEADHTGKPEVGTVEGSTALLNTILDGLRAADIEGVEVGAGVGSWQEDYLAFVDSYASTPIDFVDIHVYPVNRDYLPRVHEIAGVARSRGKQVGVSDTWLYKVREAELGVVDFPTVFGRDVFSFWAPLDAFHLETMVELAHYEQLRFMSAYWSGYFRAYVDYDDSTKDLPPEDLRRLVEAAQHVSILAGRYTSAGLAYKDAIVVPPDVTPPATPADLVARLTSPTTTAVTWSPAPDDVGTAFYAVHRDGAPVARTTSTYFLDSALAEARRYVYSVVAVDASDNRSGPASAEVTTPDVTPPSIPADLAVGASISQSLINIDLSWSAATDNVGVRTYVVYRGPSPDLLSPIGQSPTTSFTVRNAPPQTTYYFAVSAVDMAWNQSERSAPAGVTTPVIPDTSPPGVYVAYPRAGTTVSRRIYLYAVAYDVRGGVYDEPSGLAGLRFRIDGVDVGPELTVPRQVVPPSSVYRLEIDTRMWPNGRHLIAAVARDRAGNVGTSADVAVTFVNW